MGNLGPFCVQANVIIAGPAVACLSSQPPRPLPALTTLAALEPSIRLTGGLGLGLALLQELGPAIRRHLAPSSQSQDKECGCGTDLPALPLPPAHLGYPTASSELLGGAWGGGPLLPADGPNLAGVRGHTSRHH